MTINIFHKMLIQLIFLFLISDIGYSLKLPNYIQPCDRNDENFDECCLKHAEAAMPSILKGDKKYGIPEFNPLHLESVTLENSGQLSLKFNKIQIFGVERIKLHKIKLDLDHQTAFLAASIPIMNLLGNYEMNGRILVLPLDGNGKANITCSGVQFTYRFNYNVVPKKGDNYIVLDKDDLQFKVKRAYFHFSDLFNGNEAIAKSTNDVINEEWEKVVEEIKPAIKQTISTIAKTIINGFTSKIPVSELVHNY